MSKSKRRKKGRALWVKIKARIPRSVDRGALWGTLRSAINHGDYELPDDWNVTIEWRNREDAPMRSADFQTAMQESAESSRGWDRAIRAIIDRHIAREPEPESAPAKAARVTRRHFITVKSYRRRKPGQKRRTVLVHGYRYKRGGK